MYDKSNNEVSALKFLPSQHWFPIQWVRFRGGVFVLFPDFYYFGRKVF